MIIHQLLNNFYKRTKRWYFITLTFKTWLLWCTKSRTISLQFLCESYSLIKNRLLIPNVHGVTYGEKALRTFNPVIWNKMLPEKLKFCTSLDSFKKSIKEWIPTNCHCDLCRTYVPGVGYIDITDWEALINLQAKQIM